MLVLFDALQDYWDNLVHLPNYSREVSIPVCHRPFPLITVVIFVPLNASMDAGSTGSKQTLNGLFYVNEPELFSSSCGIYPQEILRDGNCYFIRTMRSPSLLRFNLNFNSAR